LTTLTLAGSAFAATPAEADSTTPLLPVICDKGTRDLWFTSTSNSRTITHARYISVPSGGSVDVTNNVTKIGTIQASVKYSSTTTVAAKEVIAEFSETVNVELAASGSITKQTSETVNFHMGPGQYAVFHGEKKFSGEWHGTQCDVSGTHETPLSGDAVSFAVPGEGAASCAGTYSSSSFEYKAKAYAC
jgi:hypothetical protein